MKHLVIMAKQPVAGKVKSRLGKGIGVINAAGVYRTLMTTTVASLKRDGRWKTWLAVAPDISLHDYPWPTDFSVFAQGQGNLGMRMQRIFDTVPPGPAIIIGTDIPFIAASDIANAFSLLGSHDMVFGKAGDGGYWLVGAKRTPCIPRVFENVRWSSKHALKDTLNNARSLRIGFAADRFDIDTKADFLKWRGLVHDRSRVAKSKP